jgi:hypothetical protein
MWIINEDTLKWENNVDTLDTNEFFFKRQELYSTRFYSKFLSGATYIPINGVDDIYDILGKWTPKSWYISNTDSPYSSTLTPIRYATSIDKSTIFDYYSRFLPEYGLTLKNKFTPRRLIKDSLKNIIEVDVATTANIDVNSKYLNLYIDGISLRAGNKVLVKNQTTLENIDSTIDPNLYFSGNYYLVNDIGSSRQYSYYNFENGIYLYDGDRLIRDDIFDDYEKCIRSSIVVKSGQVNGGLQFHLSRKLNGYYPTTSLGEHMEFVEKKNWLLRHRVDYNNVLDINYYDVILEDSVTYQILIDGVYKTFTIPERTLAVGEFGVILNTQNDISNIIPNKYKVNLRSITKTSTHYWICGDDSTLLSVRKHDFKIDKIKVDSRERLNSVSFFDDLRGVVVGELNTLIITLDGGKTWKRLRIDDFDSYTYTKVIFSEHKKIFIIGRNGVFIEIEETINGWVAYKRRISKIQDKDDEIVLNDNINDMLVTILNIHGTFSKVLLLVTDYGSFVMYGMGITKWKGSDFIYLDFDKNYNDVLNISRSGVSDNFYFTNNEGLYRFDISDFIVNGSYINSYTNVIQSGKSATFMGAYFANEMFDNDGQSLTLVGNNSFIKNGVYFPAVLFGFDGVLDVSTLSDLDTQFSSRLKSKLLFLDYDMASKLNFFTDSGEYRLPSSVALDTKIGGTSSYYSSNVFNSVGLNEKYVRINVPYLPEKTRGRLKEIRVTLNIDLVNASLVSILLRRKISNTKYLTMSVVRFGQMLGVNGNMTNVTFTTNMNYPKISTAVAPYVDGVYSMDMVSAPYYISGGISVDVDTIEGISNRIAGIDNISDEWDIFIYDPFNYGTSKQFDSQNNVKPISIEFFMENSYLNFSNKVLPPSAPSYVTKTEYNWWTYRSEVEMTFPYASGDVLDDTKKVLMSSTFSSYASYSTAFPYEISQNSNLPLNVSTSVSDFSKLFPGYNDGNISRFVLGSSISFDVATSPTVGDGPNLFLWKNIGVLQTDLNWSVDVGDLLRLESSIVDTNLLVNRIVYGTASLNGNLVSRKYIYTFTNFNENIVNGIDEITITNLNKYISVDDLVLNFSKHPLGMAYSMAYTENDGLITISPKYNNLTAYYNLGSVVNYQGVFSTMSYDDSFLRFGYSPTYNILDYLEMINKSTTNPTFYYDKEYYSLPVYNNLPILNPFTASSVYIDATGLSQSKYYNDPGNIIAFGSALYLEWLSILPNTFVDVHIDQGGTVHSAYRLLVKDKYTVTNYLSSGVNALIIEFNKRINFQTGGSLTGALVSIVSRRKLGQISEDLKELNNIQRPKLRTGEFSATASMISSFKTFERELNYKISTDSYAKVLLSDSDTVQSLSALFYIDDKNEVSMNVTNLDRLYRIDIRNTYDYNNKLAINCATKHSLSDGDGVVLSFNGGIGSSEELNIEYSGYNSVLQVLNEYDFVTNVPYGRPVFVGNDTGYVDFMKKDPFFNYQPVDIIEVGADQTTDISIKIEPEMVKLEGSTFSLVNVDWNRYRFKLVDGLTLESLDLNYPWVLEAEITDAVIGLNNGSIAWYKGVWESGRWFGGTWYSGDWLYGDWYDGSWYSYDVREKGLSYTIDRKTIDYTKSIWRTGRWYGGTWNNGTWVNGRWYSGLWESGWWYNGMWNDGTWSLGNFIGGIWINGLWKDGFFSCDNEPAFWLDGEWQSGDFENGIWYNGNFGTIGNSRFGVNSSNSRTAIWYGGKWKSGIFQSGPSMDLDGISDVHKYSIWYSGQWLSGEWAGGIAYGINFKSGVWKGGILEEVQVIGINYTNNSFILNGVFRYNIGDKIYIIDNNYGSDYSYLGSNSDPGIYTVLKVVIDEEQRITEVYTSSAISNKNLPSHKSVSDVINLSIPNTSDFLSHTQSVSYTNLDTKELRVRMDLINSYIGDLLINLSSPNGQVINVKQYAHGGTISTVGEKVGTFYKYLPPLNTEMVLTTFTTDNTGDIFKDSTSPYTYIYPMSKELNVGKITGGIPISTTNEYSGLLNNDGGVTGDWALHIWDARKDLVIPSCQVNYQNIGDRYRITINNPIGDKTKWFEIFRVGDNIELTFSSNTKIKSDISEVWSNNATSAATTYLFLSATASVNYQSEFTNNTIPGVNSDVLSPKYGIKVAKNVGIVSWSNPSDKNLLKKWELQFVGSDEIGSQIGYTINDGFDTGLRVVGKFENADWMTGIWTNGIFDYGNFRSGLWYNGILNADFGR